jgi:GT2 family glycosyltransferase
VSESHLEHVSIVVPSRGRPAYLAEALEALSLQDVGSDRFEVVVVDDGSDPALDVPDGVRLVRHDRPRGLNAARNTGVAAARYEVVWFVDDDVVAPQGWLKSIASGVARHPSAWCFGGPIRLQLEGVSFRSCAACRASPGETELDLGNVEGPISGYVFGANFGLRKRALSEAGPFDARQPLYFDEVEWQDRVRRAGGEVVYLPEAWLWHRRTHENMRFRRRLVRRFLWGRGAGHYASAQGAPVEAPAGFVRWTAHAVHHLCPIGVLNAVREVGKAVGVVEFEYRRRRVRH